MSRQSRSSSGRAAALGRGLLFAHLALGPLVFCTACQEAFEFPKVALLTLTALLLALGLAILPECGIGDVRRAMRDPIHLGVVLLMASAIVSTLSSVSPRTSLFGSPSSYAGLLTVLSYAVLFAATRMLVHTEDQARRLLTAPMVAATVAAAYACVQAVGRDPFVWDQVANVGAWKRPFATLGHATFLAAFLAMTVPLQLAAAGREWAGGRRWWSGMWGGAAILGSAAVVLTLSRGAWLALGVALLVLGAGAVRRRRRTVAVLVGVPLSVTLLLTALAVAGSSWVDPLKARFQEVASLTGRGPIWGAAWAIFREHPLTGCGLDCFPLAFAPHRTPDYWADEWGVTPSRAHDEPLQLLATQGLLGGAAGLVLLFGLTKAGWRALRDGRSELVAALVAFGVTGLFSFTVTACGALFVTLAAVVSRQPRDESRGYIRLPGADRGQPDVASGFIPGEQFPGSATIIAWRLVAAIAAMFAIATLVIRPFQADLACRAGDEALVDNLPEALDLFERAVELAPERPTGWVKLGAGAHRLARASEDSAARHRLLERACAAYAKAVRQVPVCGDFHADLGRALGDLAQYEPALVPQVFAAFDAALARDPENAYFRADACQAALQLGEVARAERCLAPVLEHYPTFGPGFYQLGLLHLAHQRPDLAKADFNRAFHSQWRGDSDGLRRTVYVWGEVCLRTGDAKQAMDLARGGLARWPRSKELLALYERAGRGLSARAAGP